MPMQLTGKRIRIISESAYAAYLAGQNGKPFPDDMITKAINHNPLFGTFHDQKSLGDILRYRRKELKLSLRGLATSTGLDYGYLSRIESGQANITIRTLTRLTQALNLLLAVETGE